MLTVSNESLECVGVHTGHYSTRVATFEVPSNGHLVSVFGEDPHQPLEIGGRYRLEVRIVPLDGTTQDHPSNPGDRTGIG